MHWTCKSFFYTILRYFCFQCNKQKYNTLCSYISDYVFSTAHKAKGLEFSTVRVTDDFAGDTTRAIVVAPEFGIGVMPPAVDSDDEDDHRHLFPIAMQPGRCKNLLSSML